MFGTFGDSHPPTALHRLSLTARLAVIAATVALGGVAMAVTAGPSGAPACNGYVGLTFDDGPTGSTGALLTVLRNNGVRATMFNVGQNVQNNRSAAQAQVAAGMWVANHSWNHAHMTSMSQAQMQSDLSQTNQAIQQATGSSPRLFRPPYGETNGTLQSVASSLGMGQVLWDVDSQDWNGASVSQIVSDRRPAPGGQVILMHDGLQNTRDADPADHGQSAQPQPVPGDDLADHRPRGRPDGGDPATRTTPARPPRPGR